MAALRLREEEAGEEEYPLEVDEEAAIKGFGGITAGTADAPPPIDMEQLKELVHNEAQQIQAQLKLPPRPPAMEEAQPAAPR